MRIDDVGVKVWCLVLKNSPNLLSIGQLNKENGFRFIIDDGMTVETPDGQIIHCEESCSVPILAVPAQDSLQTSAPTSNQDAGGDPCKELTKPPATQPHKAGGDSRDNNPGGDAQKDKVT